MNSQGFKYYSLVLIASLGLAAPSFSCEPTAEHMALLDNPTPEILRKAQRKEEYFLWENKVLEEYVLANGRALVADEITLAGRLGVKYPQKVRILYVPRIPINNTAEKLLRVQIAASLSRLTRTVAAMAAGYGLIITDRNKGVQWVLAHELVHVAQFERHGSHEAMVKRVLLERAVMPGCAPLTEQEAVDISSEVLGIEAKKYPW